MKQSTILTAFVILLMFLTSCTKPVQSFTSAELLDLGNKYLTEMNYEQAIVQFTKLIEVDPKNPRGYLGAAEAYVGLGQTDKARDILEKGLIELPDDTDIKEMLDELKSKTIETGTQSEQMPENISTTIELIKESLRTGDVKKAYSLIVSDDLMKFVSEHECHYYGNDFFSLHDYDADERIDNCSLYDGSVDVDGKRENGIYYEIIEWFLNSEACPQYFKCEITSSKYTGSFDMKNYYHDLSIYQELHGTIEDGIVSGTFATYQHYDNGHTDENPNIDEMINGYTGKEKKGATPYIFK